MLLRLVRREPDEKLAEVLVRVDGQYAVLLPVERLTVSESDLLFGLSICAAALADGGASPLGWEPDLSELR